MPKISVDKQIRTFVKDHISKQEKLDEKEKLPPLMQAIKAVHSAYSSGGSLSEEDLKRQRSGQELFSRLVTPPIGVSSRALAVKGITCEWTKPERSYDRKHIILYCHGGGYTCGSINYARILASKLALHTGLAVFSFAYRLAPENPYPAAIEDVVSIWDYLMQKGYGAGDIIVSGDSAGGNLALELCLELRRHDRMLPGGLVLMSPWTDMTMSGVSYSERLAIDPMLTPEYIEACKKAYAGEEADFARPQFSPLFSDFLDYPPTLVQAGTNEILLSDSAVLVEKLQVCGVFAALEVYEDSWHVFQQMPLKRSSRAMDSIGEFIWSHIIR